MRVTQSELRLFLRHYHAVTSGWSHELCESLLNRTIDPDGLPAQQARIVTYFACQEAAKVWPFEHETLEPIEMGEGAAREWLGETES